MRTHFRFSTLLTAAIVPWIFQLASRMLARALGMPEPLLRHTGSFVFAHVQAAEASVGKMLWPTRLEDQCGITRRRNNQSAGARPDRHENSPRAGSTRETHVQDPG